MMARHGPMCVRDVDVSLEHNLVSQSNGDSVILHYLQKLVIARN